MSGIVIDRQSRLPVARATVTVIGNLANSNTTTDMDGSFILTFIQGVQEGRSVRIRVEKVGYETYEKLVAVSSTIPLQVPLLALRATSKVPSSSPPITKSDSFMTLVPFHGEWKNSPVPMNTNLNGPHQEFFSDLFELAYRPDEQPEGWPVYKERKFESLEQPFNFVTRMMQFYVFRSIYRLQRGSSGIKWTAGVGVTPINYKPIVPPDATPYPADTLLNTLSGVEFIRPVDERLWRDKPLPLPVGTRLVLLEDGNREKGQMFKCIVRLERPDYFRIDFEVEPGIGMNDQLPAGFSTAAVQGTTTYSINIKMEYQINRRADDGFEPDQYAAWADALFRGLESQMAFDTPTKDR
jgi:hypothetical protein